MRVEARINYDGSSGVYFRSTFGPTWPAQSPWFPLGYEAQIRIKHGISDYTGSIFETADGFLGNLRESPLSPFQFFTLEVIAQENRIVIKVNGQTTANYTDPRWRHSSGHIALQQLESGTVVEFRKIEIEELPESTPSVPSSAAGQATITNTLGMKLVLIPAGEFLMGSSKDPDNYARDPEVPQHRVRITRPFYLGVTEVTQGQYRAVTGQSPSNFKGSDDLPVEQVSWDDAVNFCNALSRVEGFPPFYRVDGQNVAVPDWKGAGYRLPTEAEWEYACRAKNPARYSFGDDPAGLGEHAWFDGNSGNQTHPVGQKRPNAFGLFDMHGNVYEWCWDAFDTKYYAESPVDDPRGPSGASGRVIRGGGWHRDPLYARSAYRGWDPPGNRRHVLGFRLARVQSGG